MPRCRHKDSVANRKCVDVFSKCNSACVAASQDGKQAEQCNEDIHNHAKYNVGYNAWQLMLS